MKRALCVFAVIGFLAISCRAEARWCRITGKAPAEKLVYPAWAVLGRMRGVVSVKVVYSTDGKVTNTEAVSGQLPLSGFLIEQIKGWTIRTDASSEAPCQTLVAVNFKLYDPDVGLVESQEMPLAPEKFELKVQADLTPITVEIENIDPVLFSGIMGHLEYDIRRTWSKIFHHRQ